MTGVYDVGEFFQLGLLIISVTKSFDTGVQNPESTNPWVLSVVQSREKSPPVEHPESRDRPTAFASNDVVKSTIVPKLAVLVIDDGTILVAKDGTIEALRSILLDCDWD